MNQEPTGWEPVTVEHGDLVITFTNIGRRGAPVLHLFIANRDSGNGATFLVQGDQFAALAQLIAAERGPEPKRRVGKGELPSLLPDMLTPAEAAAFLRVHSKTLARWEKAGKVRCVFTAGGHRRYAKEDLAAFARQQGER